MNADQAYAAAFAIIWRDEEGGSAIVSTDDPADPGAYTRGGIALSQHPEMTRADLGAMTYADFFAWYRANVWGPANCDALPWPLSLIVFDGEVTSGGEGARALQGVLGLKQDGAIGPVTLHAVAAQDPVELAMLTLVARDTFFRALTDFSTFGRGWIKRLFSNIYAAGQASASVSEDSTE